MPCTKAHGTEQRVPCTEAPWFMLPELKGSAVQNIMNPATDRFPDAKHQGPATKHHGSYYRPHQNPAFQYQGSRVNPTKHQGSYYRIICPASKYALGKRVSSSRCRRPRTLLQSNRDPNFKVPSTKIRRHGSFSGTSGSLGCSVGFRLQVISRLMLIEH